MKRRWMVLCLCCTLGFTGCSLGKENDSKAEMKKHQENLIEKQLIATEVDPGIGEGTSSAELEDLTGSMEYKVGEVIPFSVGDIKYELQIEDVNYLDSSESEKKFKNVRIDYSYKNLSDDPLLIGDIRFQLTNREQSVIYSPYYAEDLKIPEPVEKGKSGEAQVEFSGVDQNEELILVYTDISLEENKPIIIDLGKIN